MRGFGRPFLDEFRNGPEWYAIPHDILQRNLKDKRYTASVQVYTVSNEKQVSGIHERKIMTEIDDFTFYPDAVYYMELVVKSKACACVAFVLNKDNQKVSDVSNIVQGKVVCIRQIQGRKGCSGLLKVVKWERLLIECVVHWAIKNRMNEVRVIRSDQQAYWPDKNGQRDSILRSITQTEKVLQNIKDGKVTAKTGYPHYWDPKRFQASLQQYQIRLDEIDRKMLRFHMHYDVTPKRMGFKPASNGKPYLTKDLRVYHNAS